jgi:hypothetical protein
MYLMGYALKEEETILKSKKTLSGHTARISLEADGRCKLEYKRNRKEPENC